MRPVPRLGSFLAAVALAAGGSGCAGKQRCRVSPWLELEYARRIDVVPGAGYGEPGVRVLVRTGAGWLETERLSAVFCHLLPDAVLLLVPSGPGGAVREAHVYRQARVEMRRIDLSGCPRPLVLAEQGALLCWACAEEPAAQAGCTAATFTELDLDGTARWERSLPLPASAAGEPCHVEELHGLSAAGHPVARVACPAPEATRWIEPWVRIDAELRPGGFTEVGHDALPRPRGSLPWLDSRCPRWAPGS